MNTTDDTLIREVDEDLRREHWAKLWKRYGALVVGGAAALVLSVAGHQGWRSYQRGIAEDAGQHFAEAEALGARDPAQATAAFAAVSANAPHGYALLARLHEAPGRATAGDTAAAQRLYAQIAADAGEPVYRDLATLLGVLAVLARPGEAITDAAALRARIEPLDQDVGGVPVPVADDDLVCARGECPAHRCINIVGHQLAEARILRVAGRYLVEVHDARNSFHVGGNQDFHASFVP